MPLFSDMTSGLKTHPIHGDIVLKVGIAAVKESVRNILTTNKYERLYKPSLGSDINALLFELPTPMTVQALKDNITTAITNFEPRVRILNLTVTVSPDDSTYYVSLFFAVVNSNETSTLDITLERVR